MPKRIAIFCDGTWNTPDQQDRGKIRPTNVTKMAQAVAGRDEHGTEQVVHYQEGVGTGGHFSWVLGGAFGYGLSSNLKSVYRFLIDAYDEGDEIYLFGYSRGAYTARSLAGMIRNCGILRREHDFRVPNAFKLYRERGKKSKPSAKKAVRFRERYAHDTTVKFIGVWDTVGALGIPISGLRRFHWLSRHWHFHDVTLSRSIENAYHALAIDERRKSFEPSLWEQNAEAVNQNFEQRWFAGAHSNIGGGFHDTGLSDLTYLWIRDKAASCGLAFGPQPQEYPLSPGERGDICNSRFWLFKYLNSYIRPIGCGERTREKVDASAKQRMQTMEPPYAPENLIAYLDCHKR